MLSALACGDAELSYSRDVQPLLEQRCVTCHHSGDTGIVDIEDPFTPDLLSPGLVGSRNPWAVGSTSMPEFNLLPFEPDSSFVLQKVTDRELRPGCDTSAGAGANAGSSSGSSTTACKTDTAGFFMPPAPRRLSEVKRASVRRWIVGGAQDNDLYRREVLPLFGDPSNRRRSECEEGGMDRGCIVCVTCHYEGSPTPPDLTHPFDPIVGIINVKSVFRSDLDLVEPGDPEQSFLMRKLDAIGASSEVGAPMPYGYRALTEPQVDVLRQWIAQGAPND
ncbi:MAG TPA: hypothetical protein VMG12_41525 [Polyangiaceae bacterium]|nr:hypothetical protein [Polyangiaceae bacterium]